jgi:uncharacterized protein (TIGR03382 family)
MRWFGRTPFPVAGFNAVAGPSFLLGTAQTVPVPGSLVLLVAGALVRVLRERRRAAAGNSRESGGF